MGVTREEYREAFYKVAEKVEAWAREDVEAGIGPSTITNLRGLMAFELIEAFWVPLKKIYNEAYLREKASREGC